MFVEIAMVVMVAAVLGVIMDRLGQPTMIGYIIAGLLVAGVAGNLTESELLITMLENLGQVGVVLLLFLVGMELSAPRVSAVGRAALLVGLGQLVVTISLGWLMTTWMGYSWISALFIAVALAFSSTVVVVKLLNERGDLHSLHGRIAVGFLLVQDMAAVFLLVLLSSLGTGAFGWETLGLLALKSILIIGAVWWLSVKGVPLIMEKLNLSPELLFLTSVAWGLGLAALMVWSPIGFTIEAGGFLAGVTLANTIQHHEIISRLRPLRDFFVMIFFVVMAFELFHTIGMVNWWQVVALSVFVLVGNPLIVVILMWQLGYRARTGFLVSLAVAQISEFSLILVGVAYSMGQVGKDTVGLITLVAIITFGVSAYLIVHGFKLWTHLGPILKKFEKKRGMIVSGVEEKKWKDHIVLIGCHRSGNMLLSHLGKYDLPMVIMDFNPEVVNMLEKQDRAVVLGDLDDVEVYEPVGLADAKIVISTVFDARGTKTMLEYLQNHGSKRNQLIVVTTDYIKEAEEFYKLGASYVNLPRLVSGWHLGQLIGRAIRKNDFEQVKIKGELEYSKIIKESVMI